MTVPQQPPPLPSWGQVLTGYHEHLRAQIARGEQPSDPQIGQLLHVCARATEYAYGRFGVGLNAMSRVQVSLENKGFAEPLFGPGAHPISSLDEAALTVRLDVANKAVALLDELRGPADAAGGALASARNTLREWANNVSVSREGPGEDGPAENPATSSSHSIEWGQDLGFAARPHDDKARQSVNMLYGVAALAGTVAENHPGFLPAGDLVVAHTVNDAVETLDRAGYSAPKMPALPPPESEVPGLLHQVRKYLERVRDNNDAAAGLAGGGRRDVDQTIAAVRKSLAAVLQPEPTAAVERLAAGMATESTATMMRGHVPQTPLSTALESGRAGRARAARNRMNPDRPSEGADTRSVPGSSA